ncbi:MAG: phenylalanine--tRNA ligase subunit alpha [Clostridiales bacterium]|nr:phenylalanine--tRNA ligase subunit alpha [Clostridiales bacterium]
MENQIAEIKSNITAEIQTVNSSKELYELKSKYLLNKAGIIPALMKELGKASKEDRPKLGQMINALKDWATQIFEGKDAEITEVEKKARYEKEAVDITMPSKKTKVGTLHPVTIIKNELVDIFAGMGFKVVETREIEDDFHNFTALNTPLEHPARDKQDTFYVSDDFMLRTHTSPGQIRSLKSIEPPFKILVPGRVYRADDDATHSPMFHQMEGLVIDENITMCDLQGMLDVLVHKMFSETAKTRFRPSFFPFTEPSVEVDVSCFECGGKGCKLCKGTGWIEILGGGIVNKKVLENCGVDSNKYTGFAFGLGLDRIAMLKNGVNNIHVLYDGDVRALKQFKD